jgi:hypothetical protein
MISCERSSGSRNASCRVVSSLPRGSGEPKSATISSRVVCTFERVPPGAVGWAATNPEWSLAAAGIK